MAVDDVDPFWPRVISLLLQVNENWLLKVSGMANDWFHFDEYHVSTVAEFVHVVLDELRSPYMFRGHADTNWELEPVIDRNDFSDARKMTTRIDRERLILDEFKRLALPHLHHVPRDDWEFLALARHHGVPTRLMDWTENPLAGLFFAVETLTETDSAVWCYTYIEREKRLDTREQPNPLELDRVAFYRPPHVDLRLSMQSGVFTVHPPNFKQMEDPWGVPPAKIFISNGVRPHLRCELQRLGVHRASLFPDLDGVGQYVCEMYRNS